MSSHPDVKYKNPPLVEVVCEIRFISTESWDLAIPGLIYNQVEDFFPVRRSRRRIHSEARATDRGLDQEFQFTQLAQFLNERENAFIQVGPNLLSVNHLKPYPTWEKYKPLTQKGIKAYISVAEPEQIRRIGLRYINRIKIPKERINLEEYFDFRPFVGSKLPQELSGFMIGIQSEYDNGQNNLRLQLKSSTADDPESTAYLLDLDYFTSQPTNVSMEEVLMWIEKAHNRIQRAFEGCLTDKLRKLFEIVEE
ncbi:MAG: TIGR04255 family protein [Anaerolineae bacterium]